MNIESLLGYYGEKEKWTAGIIPKFLNNNNNNNNKTILNKLILFDTIIDDGWIENFINL